MTLGSLVQMFGFLLLALKVYSTGSISGLSKNSVKCYLICLGFRVTAILLYDGYLPFDSSGDFIYRLSEVISLLSCSFVLYLMNFRFHKSYNHDLDSFKWYFFAIPACILAVLFHPNLNSTFFGDFTWTFALYLESVAMFPQIDVFRKKGGEIEGFTSHYVASSGFSRILHFIFWVVSFQELNDASSGVTSFLP